MASTTSFDAAAVAKLDADMKVWVDRCEAALKLQELEAETSQPPKKKAKTSKHKKGAAAAVHDSGKSATEKLLDEISEMIKQYELNKGEPLWVAEGTVQASARLPTSWGQYGALRHMPVDGEAAKCVITDALCFPLTALHAAAKLLAPPPSAGSDGLHVLAGDIARDTLTVHVIGAEDAECNGEDKWAELLQMLPGVAKLNLVMVGPEVDEELDGQMHIGALQGMGVARAMSVAGCNRMYTYSVGNVVRFVLEFQYQAQLPGGVFVGNNSCRVQ